MRLPHLVFAAACTVLGACGTAPMQAAGTVAPESVAAIVPGVSTRDEVEQAVGPPLESFAAARGQDAMARYQYNGMYGDSDQITVTYDAENRVTSTFVEPRLGR